MAGAVPELAKRFCSKCGAETITTCLSCGASIRGYYHVEGVVSIGFTWTPPAHCHNCGKAYPWTEKKASAVEEMIDELEGLNNEDRAKLKKSIPDIAAETPNSGAAVLRFKRAGAKVGQFGGKLLTDVLSKVAAEAVKKSMGL
jgi:hypothetical protein